MQILNPAVLTVLVLGLSLAVASPSRAQVDPCTANNLQTYQCGSKCRFTATEGCCNSGDWYCSGGKCFSDTGYLYCCQPWQSGSGGQCSPGTFGPFDPKR
jgi:hypothetical protein